MQIDTINKWLLQYDCEGQPLPTVFDFGRIWRSDRRRGLLFNWVCLPIYGLLLPISAAYTCLSILDGLQRYCRGFPPRDWWLCHHADCGVRYRGCHPTRCPKDHWERTGIWHPRPR